MRSTLRVIVDDIATDLKQVLDDKLIQKSKIAYWVILVSNRLKSQHVGKRDSGSFLSTFDGIPVEQKGVSKIPNEIKNRKFSRLPKTIYDYDKDGAIEYISYDRNEAKDGCPPEFTNVQFSRTTPAKSRKIYYSKYTKPTPSNPYFYIVGDYVYFLGIEKVDISNVEMGLYTSIDPVTEIDFDAPFDFPDELLIILKRQVLDLGRFALLIPEERVNDGSDDIKTGAVPTSKLVSVNELSEDQIENK